MSNSTWQKIFIGSIVISILGSIEFYYRINLPMLEKESRIEARASQLRVEIARREKFMARVRKNFGTIDLYHKNLSEREEHIKFALPDELDTTQALEIINQAAQKSESQLLRINVVEENSKQLAIQIEAAGDFFSLNNFFREIQNSGRITTLKIVEFNDGTKIRQNFPEEWIRFAKIGVTFFKFAEEE